MGTTLRTVVPTASGRLALVGVLALAACGGDDDDDDGGRARGDIEAQSVIRFAFAPDPVFNYIVGQRHPRGEGRARPASTINAFQSFDEFGLFAGGNADILSTGSYETPLLDEQGIETVTFGKYNANKDIFAAPADEDWETAGDLPEGCKVAAESTTGNLVIWQSLIDQIDGREIAEGSDDLELVTADYQIMPQLLEDGEICGAVIDPVQAHRGPADRPDQDRCTTASPRRSSTRRSSRTTRTTWGSTRTTSSPARSGSTSIPTRSHSSWTSGRRAWTSGPRTTDQIIEDYPEDFAVQSPEDEKFMQDYVKNVFDWQQESVYLTPEWIENEEGVFDLIQAAGVIEEDQSFPEHAVVDPKTGEVTETIGGDE